MQQRLTEKQRSDVFRRELEAKLPHWMHVTRQMPVEDWLNGDEWRITQEQLPECLTVYGLVRSLREIANERYMHIEPLTYVSFNAKEITFRAVLYDPCPHCGYSTRKEA